MIRPRWLLPALVAVLVLAWWMLSDPTGAGQTVVLAALLVVIAAGAVWAMTAGRGVVTVQEAYDRERRRGEEAEALEEAVYGPPCTYCGGRGQRLEQVHLEYDDTSAFGIQSLRDCPHCEGRGRRTEG
jgi:hypothetical protein